MLSFDESFNNVSTNIINSFKDMNGLLFFLYRL